MLKDRTDYLIDVEEVLGPKLMKKLPRFAINFIKRRIHQDEINELIMSVEHYCGAEFFPDALEYIGIRYQVRGIENLDKSKKYLFACNHPLGGPEGLIIGTVFNKIYDGKAFKVPSNKIMMHLKPLREFFIPINVVSSKQSRDLGTKITEMFESDSQVIIFPAGLCARKFKGKVTEMPWKKMFVTQARKHERDIVPVHISGYNSRRFFFFCWLSKILKLKFNLGMLFLVDEVFNKKGKEFIVTIGKPIPYTTLDKSKTDLEWAAEIKDIVKELSKDNGCPPNM